MEYYISVALIAVCAVLTSVISLPMLKIIQLSGYRARGIVAWVKDTNYDMPIRYFSIMLFSFITSIIFVACFYAFEWVRYCGAAFYVIFAVIFAIAVKKSGASKLKLTGRLVRLYIVNCALVFGLCALVAWATYYSVYCQTLIGAVALFVLFTPVAANYITLPFEKLNNKKYVKRARKKLQEHAPIVIGITGSFGKTTAKNILKQMLVGKYSVLATPGSYNTPMGVCKTVNNDYGGEQVFIAELGARYKGDIKELCDIVHPKYGIITAVGDMHLETMGSRQNVANVKYELGQALPQNGLLVLNGYNEDCKALVTRDSACEKVVTGEDCGYENLVINSDGTAFELVINGERHAVKTRLLGAHIAELTCVCAVIATKLGVPPKDIVFAVESLQTVEHRLQLLPSENKTVTVIDDAYNSNPVGAKNALDVLSCFAQTKVIITPGFVELGALEKPANTELGKQIAAVCDYAYLVGSRAADIQKGALSGGMNEERIKTVSSRDEAVAALSGIAEDKVVLFENDLPDNIV